MFLNNLDVSTEEIIAKLSSTGAISLPLLPLTILPSLVKAARCLDFSKLPEIVGLHKVKQQMEVYHDDNPHSQFWQLSRALQGKLQGLLTTSLEFNEVEIIRYPAGSIGITPHRDQRKYQNVICLCTLVGRGRFFTCKNRDGNDAVSHDTTPGNVIIMRGSNFRGTALSPFHYVVDIEEERIVCSFRDLTT